jgi:predicted metalloprotease with PDZ domain
LSDIDDGRSESDHSGNDVSEAGLTTHTVVINRVPGKSLGFQIASSGGNVYIKQINTEPALSANLKVDDRIVSVSFGYST